MLLDPLQGVSHARHLRYHAISRSLSGRSLANHIGGPHLVVLVEQRHIPQKGLLCGFSLNGCGVTTIRCVHMALCSGFERDSGLDNGGHVVIGRYVFVYT